MFRRLKNRLRDTIKKIRSETPGTVDSTRAQTQLRTGSPKSKVSDPELTPRRSNRQRSSSQKHPQGPQKPSKTLVTKPAKPKPTSGRPPKAWHPRMYRVPAQEGKIRFHDLNLPNPILHAIADLKFQYCTPIQAAILKDLLAGRDATGQAQTGTGKTAAFLTAIATRFLRQPLTGKRPKGTPRALIVAPTRELVLQITAEAKTLTKYCNFTIQPVFGGIDYQKQRKQLKTRAIDLLIATPGRLLDYHRQKDLHLKRVEVLVLDEADRMLDMGFIPDVRRIIHQTPPKDKRQTLFFSATLNDEIVRLASYWTRNPVRVEIEPEQVTVDTVEQVVYIVTSDQKLALVYNLITRKNLNRVMIFCNRRDEARRLTQILSNYRINCALISGEVHQKKRIRTLDNFKSGKIRVLVATDVAGRGIHVEGVSHVVNYTLPQDPEDYVHRIGRTGRAGASGTSISFASETDSFYIPAIEEFIGNQLNCSYPDDEWLQLPPPPRTKPRTAQRQKPRGRSRRPRRRPRAAKNPKRRPSKKHV